MKISNYIIAAALSIFVVFLTYFLHFYVALGYGISNNSEKWGQLGDFSGGVLNPLLSFISIVLLIKSLTLQNEASLNLRLEMNNSERVEKLRSFEILFFNLVNSQKNLFESFKIDLVVKNEVTKLMGVEAVFNIEDDIEVMRYSGKNNQEIKVYLEQIDSNDQIFGLSRAFYIMAMMITEKLSDSEGFSEKDRRAHFMTLVNFTDFAQLRLIMISVQFMDYESTKYLRSSIELRRIIEELGLGYDVY